jgi:hypothetical protein
MVNRCPVCKEKVNCWHIKGTCKCAKCGVLLAVTVKSRQTIRVLSLLVFLIMMAIDGLYSFKIHWSLKGLLIGLMMVLVLTVGHRWFAQYTRPTTCQT